MIGRETHLHHLADRLAQCRAGSAQVLFVAGPAGVGKSALVREALRRAHEFQAVEYACFEAPGLPFAPLAHLLRALRTAFDLDARRLPGYANLGLLLPELGFSTNADLATLTDALREVLAAVSGEKPLLFLLEDAHWADAATLERLPALVAGLTASPVAFVVTCRDEGLGREHPLVKLRTQLRRQPQFFELKLPLLSPQETAQLVEELLPEPPAESLTELVFAQTGGLPFFVRELTLSLLTQHQLAPTPAGLALREPAPDGHRDVPIPETVRDMVALQLDGLSAPGRDALDLAALLGEEFDLDVLGELCGDETAVDDLLAAPVFFRKTDRTAAFSHALVREVARQDIAWSKRRLLNGRIAAALEARQAPPETVGRHWLDAGAKVRARAAFAEAAGAYCRLHAYADATRTAHEALELWPKGEDEPARLDLLHQLAQCARVSGRFHLAVQALRETLESPLVRDDVRKTAETHRALAVSHALTGAWHQHKQARQAAALAHEAAELWADAAADWHELANRHTDELALGAALAAADRAVACATKADQPELVAKTLSNKGYVLAIQGQTAAGEDLAREAVALALAENHAEAAAYAYRKLAGTLEYASDFDGSLQAYDTALAVCRSANLDRQALFCMSCMSWILFRMGDWKRSLEVCREYDTPASNEASRALGHLITGLVRGYRGEVKTARRCAQEGRTMAARAGFQLVDPIMFWALGLADEVEGKPEAAREHYAALLRFGEKTGDVHDILPGLGSAVAFFAKNGLRDESHRAVQVLSRIANATGNAEAVAMLAYALGERAVSEKAYREADAHFAHAAQGFAELNLPLERLRVLASQGRARQAAGNFAEAKPPLEEALRLARTLAARPLASSLEALLAGAARPVAQPVAADSPHGLTQRQVEILRALAGGQTNKEIAAQFDLSTRTVDMHVRRLFDRLNCRTRTEAVRMALEGSLI